MQSNSGALQLIYDALQHIWNAEVELSGCPIEQLMEVSMRLFLKLVAAFVASAVMSSPILYTGLY
jgi:hypothetical protein